MKNLLPALIAAKIAFTPIKKDKTNPHYSQKYSSLDAILAAVEPSLCANGLVISHFIEEGIFVTRLYHVSGEYLETKIPFSAPSDPQKMGSLFSYLRRYSVSGLLSITADEDDDAESASKATKKSPPRVAASDNPKMDRVLELMTILKWSPEQKAEWGRNLYGKPSSGWNKDEWDGGVLDLMRLVEEATASH